MRAHYSGSMSAWACSVVGGPSMLLSTFSPRRMEHFMCYPLSQAEALLLLDLANALGCQALN